MLFNSLEFFVFLPLVFALFWLASGKWRNIVILIASYVFYGWWDWRFLLLIFLSSTVDFGVGISLGKASRVKVRRSLLFTSLAVNLGMLGFFKYYNFFVESFVAAFAGVGVELQVSTLSIILPVGISFYTFQTLSYTIDVYKGKISPCTSPIAFFSFVSFFPQLVAGPIERASHLLPQFLSERTFSYEKAIDGVKQMLWGFFKKIVIADTCAIHVNAIFQGHNEVSAGALLLGAIYFAFQIYCDFSGYSDIAIGCARLFGFDLMTNFRYPYFSRDIAEFWRRWHISLSTWFRDYLYIPLGGSRGSTMLKLRNVMIIFLVSGFWHGANWTFIVWGALNAIYFLPLMLRKKNRENMDIAAKGNLLPSFSTFLSILNTFVLTTLGWIFFRAESLNHAFAYLFNLFDTSIIDFPVKYLDVLPMIFCLIAFEWIQRDKLYPLQFTRLHRGIRVFIYSVVFYMTIQFVSTDSSEFIYFQF